MQEARLNLLMGLSGFKFMKKYFLSLCAYKTAGLVGTQFCNSFDHILSSFCFDGALYISRDSIFLCSPLGSPPALLCTSTQPFYCPEGMKATEVKMYSRQYNLLSTLVLVHPKAACGVQMLAYRCLQLLKKFLHSSSSFLSRSSYCEESFRLPQLQVTQYVWMFCYGLGRQSLG